MRKIAIIGAGITGLLLAIQFKKLGLDVVVVDPRAGTYTRPGILNAQIFDAISQQVGKYVNYSSSMHIKDAERSLFLIARSMKVNIEKTSFVGLSKNFVHIKYSNESIKRLACDLVIDASGSSRVVINEVNKLKPNSFNMQPIDTPPNKRHLIAYVKINDEDRLILEKLKNKKISVEIEDYVKSLEELRAMGWDGFVAPTFFVYLLEKKKACFYVELPSELTDENYPSWLRKVMILKTGKKNITFEQIPRTAKSKRDKTKIRFSAFNVYPHKVVEAYFQSEDLPVVLRAGDAGIEPEYRIGIGVETAIKQVGNLFSALKITDDHEFDIDFKLYESLLKSSTETHENKIKNYYDRKRLEVGAALIKEQNNYSQLLAKSKDNYSLRKSYEELCAAIYEVAISKFKRSLNDKGEIICDNYGLTDKTAENNIEESIRVLQLALSMDANDDIKKLIENELLTIALKYKETAIYFYKLYKFGTSKRFFNTALDLLQKYFSDTGKDSIFKIKYHILKICYKEKKFDELVFLSADLCALATSIELHDKNDFLEKISCIKELALTQQVDKVASIKNHSIR